MPDGRKRWLEFQPKCSRSYSRKRGQRILAALDPRLLVCPAAPSSLHVNRHHSHEVNSRCVSGLTLRSSSDFTPAHSESTMLK